MKMFLGGPDSADITHSIFNTECHGQGQGQGPGSQNLGGISEKVYARIDNERGLFVLHPDLLISPTKIAEAIGCVRRGVISERVKSLGGFNKAAVLGNLRHSFIEVRGVTDSAVTSANASNVGSYVQVATEIATDGI
jgi:DNA replication factor Dna2